MNTYYYFNNPKLPIYVTDKTIEITPYTFNKNGDLWEQQSLYQFFSKIDNKNYNIVDIGGQSGLYSLYAKYLPNSTFYTFEPFIDTFNLLNDNLILNKVTNVKTYNIGMSDTSGIAILNTSINHNGLHTMGKTPLRFNDIKTIKIETDTLDNCFYHKNIHVDYIKIDTEGWEYNILKGGAFTIKKYRPIIQLEWNVTNMAQCSTNENDLLNLLLEYDYYEHSMVEEEKLFYPNKH
jgi:FkbM family methyltransferase